MIWDCVYEKAINDDGTLYFPAKLSREFLDQARRILGSYIFANQYQNIIIPLDAQSFRKEWFTYKDTLPERVNTFIFIDPAISQADSADFTGVVVVSVDHSQRWYVRLARRYKITPTELVSLIFRLNQEYAPQTIGIEEVAYQAALPYFLHEEMRRRNILLPIMGIKPPNSKTKQMRILSLVPRFEWGHIYLKNGLDVLELELLTFPRGAHDDLIDSLAYIEYIVTYPTEEKKDQKPASPNHPDYEKWYIQNRIKQSQGDSNEYE